MLAACARRAAALAFGVFALLGAGAWAQPAPDYAAVIAAPDRSDAETNGAIRYCFLISSRCAPA